MLALKWNKTIDVIVFNSRESTVRSTATGGYALDAMAILLYIDCSSKYANMAVDRWVKASLQHELAHIVRNATRGYGKTLLETMVSEGTASYVEQGLNQKLRIPYIQRIRGEEKFLRHAKKIMKRKKYDHGAWYFGSGAIPNWMGYRLGYNIVSAFMKRCPKVSIAELVRLPAQQIYAGK